MNVSKLFNKMTSVLAIILVVWLGLSYMEIITKNTRANPVYNKGNVIIMLVEWAEDCEK